MDRRVVCWRKLDWARSRGGDSEHTTASEQREDPRSVSAMQAIVRAFRDVDGLGMRLREPPLKVELRRDLAILPCVHPCGFQRAKPKRPPVPPSFLGHRFITLVPRDEHKVSSEGGPLRMVERIEARGESSHTPFP